MRRLQSEVCDGDVQGFVPNRPSNRMMGKIGQDLSGFLRQIDQRLVAAQVYIQLPDSYLIAT